MLLTFHQDAADQVTYGMAVEAAQAQLRQVVGETNPATSAQIVAASEKVLGPVGHVTLN